MIDRPWTTGPRRPKAPAAEVHVWRADLGRGDWPGPERLPAAERERAAAFRRPGSAQRWTASRWALRDVLSRYLGEEPAAIELAAGAHGKPELAADPARLRFNLSHSGELALIAVTAGRQVGIDIERIDLSRDVLALAERGLAPAEAASVRAAKAADRAAVFYAAWVRREALVKCLGSGLGRPPAAAPVTVRMLAAGPGYAAADAVGGEEALPRRCFTIAPAPGGPS